MATTFELDPSIDVAELTRQFAAHGRVRIPRFLRAEHAEALRLALRARDDWVQVINSSDKVVELDRGTRASLQQGQSRQLDDAVYAGARTGFQYRYEAIRVPDDAKDRLRSEDILTDLARFLSDGPARDLLRTIVGEEAIAFADAQATAYSPGDFLTGHDDVVPGKSRFAAYVLSLNPVWRIEWGGLLLMHEGGDAVRGTAPAFNTLDLLKVGQMHSVSEVTRASPYRRYSVTGWLRAK